MGGDLIVFLYFISIIGILLFCLVSADKMLFSSFPLFFASALFLDEILPDILNFLGYKKAAASIKHPMLIVMSFLPLLVVNSTFWTFRFLVPLGTMLNLIAVGINSWRMHVVNLDPNSNYNEYTHAPANGSTRLIFLVDRINHWSFGVRDVSIGDLFILGGAIVAAIQIGLLCIV